ncbi:MAG: HAMP domain-containing sensor histidine kinase [Actinobacteria bacterium]|nr:HAMP domain-containing sensor histidine kinase [Actinomycetota bacterium]
MKAKNDIFFRAKLKLTFLYLLIIVIIILIFSFFIYFSFSLRLPEEIKHELSEGDANIGNIFVAAASRSLLNLIIIIDISTIVVSGFLSYWLAAKTLEPIKKSHLFQKQFISDASHELRTPLSIMKTGIELEVRNKDSNKSYREMLESNLEEVDRMSAIVEDLLLLARLENNQENFKFAEISLNAVLKKIVNLSKPYAERKNITILSGFTEEELFCNADENKISQALLNLIKNAVDYSYNNGKIEISLHKSGNKAEAIIRDYGIGIKKENLSNIFNRFFRADSEMAAKLKGSGLGLAITKEIIEKNKGSIIVESEPDKGTKIKVNLPLIV